MKWFSVLIIVLVILLNSCSKNSNPLPKVDVFGHAGTSLHRDRAIFPANSFESIKYAIDVLDADGVEVDIQMTKDSILILFHDKYLEFSTNFFGCISQYTFNELKTAKLDNTSYELVDLKTVLVFLENRKKTIFLDIKSYNYCEGKSMSQATFNFALAQSFNNLTNEFIEEIIVSNASSVFLNQINHPNKCLVISNVKKGINNLNYFGFNSLLINLKNVSEVEIDELNNYKWGIQGIKDEWTVDDAVKLIPKFVITDNIAYTKKVTN